MTIGDGAVGHSDPDCLESVTHRGPPPGVGIPGPALLSRTYERNAAGEPTRIHKQDGSYTEVDYDPAGRVQAERYFDEVDTLLETITYTYDLDGNRTSRTSSAGLEVYEYDPGSRLTRVTLDGVETQRFEYDENGRVSRIVRDGLDQRLHWDALDRLVRIEDLSFVEDAVDFAYDGQGRRVSADRADSAQRYVVGPTGNPSLESPHLVHNGFFLTGELVYGGEHALWRYDGSEPPDTRVYLRDAMGSVIGLMDEEGNLLETFEYDAFGNVRSPGGEALPEVNLGGDSRFQGMWKDAGTGLYYVRARYYDPRTGRFLSRDPAEGQLEQPASFEPYVFANSNPYILRDPTGEFSLSDFSVASTVRNVLATTGRSLSGLRELRLLRRTADLSRRASRFVFDNRKFRDISREYWARKGGANGSSLHHWLLPQRATWVPQGLRNAGWNLLELPPFRGVFHRSLSLNTWMGFAARWGGREALKAAVTENMIRALITGTYVAAGYGSVELLDQIEELLDLLGDEDD